MNLKLQVGEEILVDTKPASLVAWYWLLNRGVALLILPVLVFFIKLFLSNFYGLPFIGAILFGLAAFLLVLGLGYLWFKTVANAYHYVVTNQRVIIRYGFIMINQRMIPLSQINDINMRSTLFERFFGLGSVYIDTLGTLLGAGSVMANAASNFFSANSRGTVMNNTSRLEGLTYAQCDEVMNAISSHIQKLRSNQQI